MDWGSVPPLLTVVLASLVALAGAMWAVLKVIRVELAERFDARFDAVDSRFDALDKRVDGVDRRFDELRVDMRALTERVDRIVEGIPPLQPA